MKRKPNSRRKRSCTKSLLRLPDLEHAKAAVLIEQDCSAELTRLRRRGERASRKRRSGTSGPFYDIEIRRISMTGNVGNAPACGSAWQATRDLPKPSSSGTSSN
jgi:hypothetical protein